ncbi:MAG: glycine cleavage system aminomethyltransferase GcvT [Porticoccus sp.]|jgi:aminomethyltransferase|uniref:glycine cleavage system aminomethyltransferase GcvT n=1 Tax=Porticoccus sp. Uisw_050_02 TaxID=3230978 RepID=UPI001D84BAE4|nr:glycine cleavage system aminomethyltransferase GcvT [Porticoccus sp.]|tara:strand:- start:6570 stop:7697 length:1128 start_codon:yes stop_codon:yes gene_type:complete
MNQNNSNTLKATPLKDLHLQLDARMVPFAGYEMPVQYPSGVKKEHLHTRQHAGLFDVSHMGQIIITGKGVAKALETLIPVELESLGVNKQTYALLTNDHGGILDDLMITRWSEDCFFLVVNAGCKDRDLKYLRDNLDGFNIDHMENQGLLALQGPAAEQVIKDLAPESQEMLFMSGSRVNLAGIDCYITRSGYTGEDGFEISAPPEFSEPLARKLLSYERVRAAGLGARDSLRLEAGLCLYGHDIDAQTTPIQASLLWSISKSRRSDGEKSGGFPGAEIIFQETMHGPTRKRVGLKVEGRAPVREGAELVNKKNEVIGIVTSGGFGPTLDAPLAMGYVKTEYSKIGTEFGAIVRGKVHPVFVQKMPFVPNRYYRG